MTDNDGMQVSTTTSVDVASPPPVARFTISCPGLSCTVDATGSSDPDGTVAGYAWTFGDGGTATGPTPMHAFDAAGSYHITLTVTDNSGGTATATQTVNVADLQSPIAFVAGSAVNKSATSFGVPVPAAVQEGDELLLTLTDNNTARATAPAGWQQVGSQLLSSDGLNGASTVWQRVAGAADVGTTVTVGLSANARAAVTLVAYRGTSSTASVVGSWSAAETVSRATHTTPSASGIPPGGVRRQLLGGPVVDHGRVDAAGRRGDASDQHRCCGHDGACRRPRHRLERQVPAGSRAGRTATADTASGKAAMWTLVLAPDGS